MSQPIFVQKVSSATNETEAILTRTECEKILANACKGEQNLELKTFTLESAVYSNGFLGEYYHLLLYYYSVAAAEEHENSAPRRDLRQLRAFVKRLPEASVEPEKEAIFRKEAALYATLLERLRPYSSAPWSSCHFYSRDDLIVLEQLDQLDYALCSEIHENLSDYYLRQVLRGLAAQHASSIACEVKEGICVGDTYPQLQYEITVSARVPWYTRGLHAILAVIQQQLTLRSPVLKEPIEARLPAAIESVYEMTNSSVKYRNVLCHRDVWRGNIFYKNTTTPRSDDEDLSALFVDYQTARYCPPAIDLIHAFFMNLSKERRKNKEREYLLYYHHWLERDLRVNGVEVEEHISQAELLASYEDFQLFGLLYKAIALTILKVPRDRVTNEYVHVERTSAVLRLMDELPEFRKCLVDAVEELLDFLIPNMHSF